MFVQILYEMLFMATKLQTWWQCETLKYSYSTMIQSYVQAQQVKWWI
jgi:hypothetical protein